MALQLLNFKANHVNNCGMCYLTQLDGVKSGKVSVTEGQQYKYVGVEEAVLSACVKGGFYADPRNTPYGPPPINHPPEFQYINVSAVAWSDADGFGNGDVLAQFFIDKGHVVHITEIGQNKRYGTAAGHKLRHYIALINKKTSPEEAGKFTMVREYQYVPEGSAASVPPVPSIGTQSNEGGSASPRGGVPEGIRTRLGVLGRATRAGVRAAGGRRPLRATIR